MNLELTNTIRLKQITYSELESKPPAYDNITEIVTKARGLAWRESEKLKDTDKVVDFKFAPVESEIHGKMYHLVKIPKYLMDNSLNSKMSRDEFNQWHWKKSIYERTLIQDLS
jgi:hypothetical protein